MPAEKAQQKNPLIEMFRQISGRYLILGIIAWGAYVISNQSVSIFMPSLMIRDLGASPDVVRSATLLDTLWGGACMIALGAYSDRIGRKFGVIGPSIIAIIASATLFYASGTKYAGSLWVWPVFWCYLLWTVGQSAAAMFGR